MKNKAYHYFTIFIALLGALASSCKKEPLELRHLPIVARCEQLVLTTNIPPPRLHLAGIRYVPSWAIFQRNQQVYYMIYGGEGWGQCRSGVCYASTAENASIEKGIVIENQENPSAAGALSVNFSVSYVAQRNMAYFRAFAVNNKGEVVYSDHMVWRLGMKHQWE